MKTLDEVIVELENYPVVGGTTLTFDVIVVPERSLNDALHYLQQYRDKAHRLDIDIADHRRSFEQLGIEIERYQEAVKNCEEAENKYRQLAQNLGEVGNDPLSWDELRRIDEEPIWIEVKNGEKKWVITFIDPDDVDRIYITDAYGLRGILNIKMYFKGEIKAYKKERK